MLRHWLLLCKRRGVGWSCCDALLSVGDAEGAAAVDSTTRPAPRCFSTALASLRDGEVRLVSLRLNADVMTSDSFVWPEISLSSLFCWSMTRPTSNAPPLCEVGLCLEKSLLALLFWTPGPRKNLPPRYEMRCAVARRLKRSVAGIPTDGPGHFVWAPGLPD